MSTAVGREPPPPIGTPVYSWACLKNIQAKAAPATGSPADAIAESCGPGTIRSLAAKAPNTATPVAAVAWRAAFSTAAAVPENALSTIARMDVVMAGTPNPVPKGIIRKAGSISVNWPRRPNGSNRRYPTASMELPTIMSIRMPSSVMIQPLRMC
jgi:hypothetical protein